MGLSSKQVSSTGLDWNQESQDLELNPKPPHLIMRKQQQQNAATAQNSSEAVKCPRCDSANTKFCYYNNYNKSQPRHFCRACKRHWTKGGTLRNVPVGGGRKKNNKRPKKSPSSSTTTTTSSTTTTSMTIQTPLAVDGQKNMPSSLYQALIRPPSLLLQQSTLFENRDFGFGNQNFLPPLPLPLPHQNQNFLLPFPTSTSLQSSNAVYNCGEEFKNMEESTVNSIIMPSNNNTLQPWEIAAASGGGGGSGGGSMGIMPSYWSWEDFDSLVSTDLNNNPWDDNSDDIIKP